MLFGDDALRSRGNRRRTEIRMDHHAGPRPLSGELRRRGEGHRRGLAAPVVVFFIWGGAHNFVDGGGVIRAGGGQPSFPLWGWARQKSRKKNVISHRPSLR